jgi:AcrR family transcriptional regulator
MSGADRVDAMAAPDGARRGAASTRETDVDRRIIRATERLLEDVPYRDLTVEMVVEAAHLSREDFDRYFPDLDAVLLRGLAETSDELNQAAELWFDASSDPDQTLEVSGAALITAFERHGSLFRAFNDAAATGPTLEETWRAIVYSFADRCTVRLEQMNRDGLSHIEHPKETSRAMAWMLSAYLLDSFSRTNDVSPQEALETLSTIWRRVLFTTGG